MRAARAHRRIRAAVWALALAGALAGTACGSDAPAAGPAREDRDAPLKVRLEPRLGTESPTAASPAVVAGDAVSKAARRVTRVEIPAEPPTAAAPSADAAAEAATTLDVQAVARAVVQVEAARRQANGGYSVVAQGSGTLVDPSGLVLTNYHVVEPGLGHDTIVIAVTEALDRAPIERYIAVVQVADQTLDLAVLRLISTLDGTAVTAGDPALPTLPLGDAAAVAVLDRVLAFGYPGIGEDTITVTEGAVSGFLPQEGLAETRAWIKTDTTISYGNSGGAAVDGRGRLIGVPTQISADPGGTIAHLRPINLAAPLIARAQRGEVSVPAGGAERASAPVVNIRIGTGLTAPGDLSGDGNRLPGGTRTIFYTFDYSGLADGVAWVDRWSVDGTPIPELSAPRPPWRHGPTGTFLTGIEEPAGFRDGLYMLEIVVENVVVAARSVAVGDAVLPGPVITGVTFSEFLTPDEHAAEAATTMPIGAHSIYAVFTYEAAAAARSISAVWTQNGVPIFTLAPQPWNGSDTGSAWVNLNNADGFPPGAITVTVLFDGVPAGTATVRVD